MKEIEFSYDVTVRQTGLLSVTLPSHFVALAVAEKLGLPIPNRNDQCEVNVTDPVEQESGEHMVNIDFEYLADVKTGPVTLKAPLAPAPVADEATTA